ncbi:unnamed protein product [Rotaria sp. Silwood1]|nr:unnamed protein product [Rotaria sp. Silwood1]
MEHLFSALSNLHHSIRIGGYWTIPNFLWNPITNHRCNLEKVNMCRPELWNHHDDIKISCFENEFELLKWSKQILIPTKHLDSRIPNAETDFESLLPFPNLFNVTIINVEQSQICQKSSSIVCHKRMDLHNDRKCSFYLCHTTKSTELINVTFQYEPTKIMVTMSMMCHPLTKKQTRDYRTFKEDKICHFLSPQANFFLCDNQF